MVTCPPRLACLYQRGGRSRAAQPEPLAAALVRDPRWSRGAVLPEDRSTLHPWDRDILLRRPSPLASRSASSRVVPPACVPAATPPVAPRSQPGQSVPAKPPLTPAEPPPSCHRAAGDQHGGAAVDTRHTHAHADRHAAPALPAIRWSRPGYPPIWARSQRRELSRFGTPGLGPFSLPAPPVHASIGRDNHPEPALFDIESRNSLGSGLPVRVCLLVPAIRPAAVGCVASTRCAAGALPRWPSVRPHIPTRRVPEATAWTVETRCHRGSFANGCLRSSRCGLDDSR